MIRKENEIKNNTLDDEQVAENLTDLVSIINAKGDTKKIEQIIEENKNSFDDDSNRN
ncbi:hypothetical protein [Neobacillus piezotolerans]|uniref:hypothetical protein n=1 Tax=Neobacillus piezotolerans TaxID=2259171 RepID=UPI0015F18AC1|nr:hypothetical protein [Neobacillus piezotolerans]